MLPQSAADYLTAVGQTAMESKRRLDALGTPEFVEFPALWTDYDVATGRCAWREQIFDPTSGERIDHPNGRSGTFEKQPAFPVGGGTIPDFEAGGSGSGSGSGTTTGVEVWMRFRTVTPGVGPVYEFDWPDSGGGGGASGSPVILSDNTIITSGGTSAETINSGNLPAGEYIVVLSAFTSASWSGTGTGISGQLDVELTVAGGTVLVGPVALQAVFFAFTSTQTIAESSSAVWKIVTTTDNPDFTLSFTQSGTVGATGSIQWSMVVR
jgi:hypothetical protein